MEEYIKYFETQEEYDEYVTSGNMKNPNVSYCEDVKDVHYNPWTWADEYFTTVALESGTITLNIPGHIDTHNISYVSYSTNGGASWVDTVDVNDFVEETPITINVSKGDAILWKCGSKYYEIPSGLGGCFFSSTCNFNVMGNIMSLVCGDNFKGANRGSEFSNLFKDVNGNKECLLVDASNLIFPTVSIGCKSMFSDCTSLVKAPKLPATSLGYYQCYYDMFSGCTSLTTAPELPATTLVGNCYSSMFSGCTSLITAPELPATILAEECYSRMYYGCTALTTAPELPATTLADHCYSSMFSGCISLTTAPELPATTLSSNCYSCYQSMFEGCTSLTTAPELPIINLNSSYGCYYSMFKGCTNLNCIKAMFTTEPSSYTNSWVDGVSATGTFVKNANATWNVSGVNGIPEGWTVETATV